MLLKLKPNGSRRYYSVRPDEVEIEAKMFIIRTKIRSNSAMTQVLSIDWLEACLGDSHCPFSSSRYQPLFYLRLKLSIKFKTSLKGVCNTVIGAD